LTLSVALELGPLISGLRAAVLADVWEILKLPSKPPAVPLSPPQGPEN
jgi:hypothetical protein